MKEKGIWNQNECEQYERNLAVVTLTKPFISRLSYSKNNSESSLIKKLKLFQAEEKKLWKGIDVAATGRPGISPIHIVGMGVLLGKETPVIAEVQKVIQEMEVD